MCFYLYMDTAFSTNAEFVAIKQSPISSLHIHRTSKGVCVLQQVFCVATFPASSSPADQTSSPRATDTCELAWNIPHSTLLILIQYIQIGCLQHHFLFYLRIDCWGEKGNRLSVGKNLTQMHGNQQIQGVQPFPKERERWANSHT